MSQNLMFDQIFVQGFRLYLYFGLNIDLQAFFRFYLNLLIFLNLLLNLFLKIPKTFHIMNPYFAN